MLTLTLIFYGLVAFVPSDNGEGAMVVFPSPDGLVDPHGCTISAHEPQIFQVKYSPYGDPERLVRIKFPRGRPSYIEPEYSPSIGLSQSFGLRAVLNGNPLVFPMDLNQASDISWIPAVDQLNFFAGGFRSECLSRPSECKISLMVRTWQGDARACHLAHPNEPVIKDDRKSLGKFGCGVSGSMLAYRLKDLGAPSTAGDMLQAVADAFTIKMSFVRAPEISLYLIDSDGMEDRLPIQFGSAENITLLLANVPKDPDVGHDRCHNPGVDHHFYSYYDLATTDPQYLASWPIPQTTFESAPDQVEMGCEGEITLLEQRLIRAYRKAHPERRDDVPYCPEQVPHSVEVCSTARFGLTALPSLRSDPPQRATTAARSAASGAQTGPKRPSRVAPGTGAPVSSTVVPSRAVAVPLAPASTAPTTANPPPG